MLTGLGWGTFVAATVNGYKKSYSLGFPWAVKAKQSNEYWVKLIDTTNKYICLVCQIITNYQGKYAQESMVRRRENT